MSEDTIQIADAGEESARYDGGVTIGPRPDGAYIGLNHHVVIVCDSHRRANRHLVQRGQADPERRMPCPVCGRKAIVRIVCDHD